jgi:hypothetical protein
MSPSNRRRLLVPSALIVLAVHLGAQTPRPQLSGVQAQQFEANLRSNPGDLSARSALLDYYYLNSSLSAAVAIPARRRHILWLIENAAGDELAGSPAATIDSAGHRLADPQGFKLASDAWRKQTARPDIGAAALANAAYFFKLSDRTFSIGLLERALMLEPGNKEIGARLGLDYALAIMGVTMVNKNGYPLGADPQQIQSPLAQLAHDALATSANPIVLAVAGYQLSFQGAILRGSGKLEFDTGPLAESVLQRAVRLAPGDPNIANLMQQHREIQREAQAAAQSLR